jgi:hypothetical protein
MRISDENEVLKELNHVKNINENKAGEWNTYLNASFERWSKYFKFIQSEGISLKRIHTNL